MAARVPRAPEAHGASVAQLAEHLICNQAVAGSSPAAGSTSGVGAARRWHLRVATQVLRWVIAASGAFKRAGAGADDEALPDNETPFLEKTRGSGTRPGSIWMARGFRGASRRGATSPDRLRRVLRLDPSIEQPAAAKARTASRGGLRHESGTCIAEHPCAAHPCAGQCDFGRNATSVVMRLRSCGAVVVLLGRAPRVRAG